jgi:hypothetical protein
VKIHGAAAGGAANDKPGVDHIEADRAAVGIGSSREAHTNQCESDQRCTNGD